MLLVVIVATQLAASELSEHMLLLFLHHWYSQKLRKQWLSFITKKSYQMFTSSSLYTSVSHLLPCWKLARLCSIYVNCQILAWSPGLLTTFSTLMQPTSSPLAQLHQNHGSLIFRISGSNTVQYSSPIIASQTPSIQRKFQKVGQEEGDWLLRTLSPCRGSWLGLTCVFQAKLHVLDKTSSIVKASQVK